MPGRAQMFPFLFPSDSPIWDWATNVEVRSQSGEKGRPSSASLSPWEEDRCLRIGRAGEMSGCNGKRMLPHDLKMRVHRETQNPAELIET